MSYADDFVFWIDNLEKMGLAKRSRSSEDGRLVIVTLQPKGHKLMEHLFPEFNRHEIDVVGPVAKNQRVALADMLRAITAKIEG